MPDNNALHIAAESGNLVEVQYQVSNFDINDKGEFEGTALYWAARGGYADIVKLLLTLNADANIPDVRTLKMTSIHPSSSDMYFLPPSYLLYTLLSTPRGMYCHHTYRCTTLNQLMYIQLYLSLLPLPSSFPYHLDTHLRTHTITCCNILIRVYTHIHVYTYVPTYISIRIPPSPTNTHTPTNILLQSIYPPYTV